MNNAYAERLARELAELDEIRLSAMVQQLLHSGKFAEPLKELQRISELPNSGMSFSVHAILLRHQMTERASKILSSPINPPRRDSCSSTLSKSEIASSQSLTQTGDDNSDK